jgi:hypothetical protein
MQFRKSVVNISIVVYVDGCVNIISLTCNSLLSKVLQYKFDCIMLQIRSDEMWQVFFVWQATMITSSL